MSKQIEELELKFKVVVNVQSAAKFQTKGTINYSITVPPINFFLYFSLQILYTILF